VSYSMRAGRLLHTELPKKGRRGESSLLTEILGDVGGEWDGENRRKRVQQVGCFVLFTPEFLKNSPSSGEKEKRNELGKGNCRSFFKFRFC